MDMFPTVEVRWFKPGSIDGIAREWFENLPGRPDEQPARIDRYLQVVTGSSLGIKVREGRLEIKQLTAEMGVRRFHPRMTGKIERWRKWGFELAGEDSLDAPNGPWRAVTKRRSLYRYRVTGADGLEELPLWQQVPWGCDLELTSVNIGEAAWWSVGLEAFGFEQALDEKLMLTVKAILSLSEPPFLEAADSYGYPRWLELIAHGQRGG